MQTTVAQVRMRFVVGGVWTALDVLGATFELEYDSVRVRVSLPEYPEAFSELREASSYQQWLPSFTVAGPVTEEPGRDTRTVALLIVEVAVDVQTAFPPVKPSEEDWTDELTQIATMDLRRGAAAAEAVAGSLARHLRAAAPNQTWLGLSATNPVQYGLAEFEYTATGERILAQGPEQSIQFHSSRIRVEHAAWAALVESMTAGDEPDVARSLLADAAHLTDARAANDQDRGLLVAATACEVYIKLVLRRLADPGQLRLLELNLKRRSNLPELVDETCGALLGISLRKEDPGLYKQVRALADQRNAIVHAGHRDPQAGVVSSPAAVAAQLFKWLDQLGS